MKYQRSNSWGEACEEALQPLGTHFSPLNTVARHMFAEVAAADIGSDFVDTVNLQNDVIMDVL